MIIGRYQPKHYDETTKDICAYCHRTPASWRQVGNEKICAHCGTRVFNSAATMTNLVLKHSNR